MAIKDKRSRKVKIEWRIKKSTYLEINKDVLVVNEKPLGATGNANKQMLAQGDLLESVMPTIVGADPKSNKSDWDNLIQNYFNGIHILIPQQGKELEIGFEYDIKDSHRQDEIKELIGDKKITTSSKFADLVESLDGKGDYKIDPDTWFRYGQPIDNESYIIYRYAKYHAYVANTKIDAEKSPKIKFFIHTDAEERKIREMKVSANTESMKMYLELLSDEDQVDNVIMMYDRSMFSFVDVSAKHEFLNKERINNPSKFISITGDKHLIVKSNVEKYIKAGILRRLAHTTTVVDASDPSIILGINIDETVSYFSNDINKAKIKEFESIYKSKKI